jgi:hypothetical protein
VVDLTDNFEKFSFASYQTSAQERHQTFIQMPLKPNLDSVPGIGPAAIQALESASIFNTWQLIAKYMSYGPDGHDKFDQYLSQFSAIGKYRATIVRAVSEKVALSFGLSGFIHT